MTSNRRGSCIVLLAFIVGTCTTFFLLWRRWSHAWGFRIFGLPPLMLELNLYSENAFYYSFYKQVIEAPSMREAFRVLREDDRTEHPVKIDSLSRFNLMPELLLGALYRAIPARTINILATVVPMCDGAQEGCLPFWLYAGTMLMGNSIGSGVLCAMSCHAGGNELACAAAELGLWVGMLTVPVSRTIGVHVAALRENFALPLLHVQTALLALLMRSAKLGQVSQIMRYIAFSFATILLLFFWQFAGFVLCMQGAAAFASYLLLQEDFVRTVLLRVVVIYAVAIVVQGFSMPGGSAFELSPLPETVGGIGFAVFAALGRRIGAPSLFGGLADGVVSILVFGAFRKLKVSAGLVPLSAHVDELLMIKFRRGARHAMDLFKSALNGRLPALYARISEQVQTFISKEKATFDSEVYLQMDEFKSVWDEDVLKKHVLENNGAKKTIGLGLACTALVLLLILATVVVRERRKRLALATASQKRAADDDDDSCAADQHTQKRIKLASPLDLSGTSVHDLIFLMMLFIFYAGLTALVWRLRVLALPLLAVVASLSLSPRLWSQACPCCCRRRAHMHSIVRFFFFVLKWAGGIVGLSTAYLYLEMLDTFYNSGLNPDTEHEERIAMYNMFTWISAGNNSNIVLAGNPTTLASARLGLPGAAVVAHPHYEDPVARKRFKEMKELLYACSSWKNTHDRLLRYNVTHVLFDFKGLNPGEALKLSSFYKKRNRCSRNMDLLGTDRTAFQAIFDNTGYFKPLHVAGSYLLVKLVRGANTSNEISWRGGHPGNPASWAPILDRCSRGARASSLEMCSDNLGLLVRALANPLHQHEWSRSLAARAQERYPKSSRLHFVLALVFDYDLSNFQEAERLYQKAIDLDPQNIPALMALGGLFADPQIPFYGKKKKKEITEFAERLAPLLLAAPPGPGVRDLAAQRLCDVASWTRKVGIKGKWEAAFWQTAKLRSHHGCLHKNWPLMEGGSPRSMLKLAWDYLRFAD